MTYPQALENYPELLEKVAAHLTGRPCVVRWSVPVQGAAGCAMKSGSTCGVIALLPGSYPLIDLEHFLHECAHIRLHWDILPAFDAAAKPGSQPANPPAVQAEHKRTIEPEAAALAEVWSLFADENHHKKMCANDEKQIPARLACLLD